jgi:hypothetical protein
MNYESASGLCYIEDFLFLFLFLKNIEINENKWGQRPSNGGITKVLWLCRQCRCITRMWLCCHFQPCTTLKTLFEKKMVHQS